MSKTEVKMVVTEALTERKLLRKRIEKATTSGYFFGVVIGDKKTPHNKVFANQETESAKIQSTFDTVRSLQNKYYALVAALVNSNANTTLVIGSKEMTVAAAIEYKESIVMEKALIKEMTRQLTDTSATVRTLDNRANADIQEKLKVMHSTADASKVSEDDFNNVHNPHMAQFKPLLHDPLQLVEWIDTKSTELDEFEAAVENALNVKNATTEITFSY